MAIEWAMSQLPAAANQKRKKGNERRKLLRKKRSTKNPPLAKRAGGWASQNAPLKSQRRGVALCSAKMLTILSCGFASNCFEQCVLSVCKL